MMAQFTRSDGFNTTNWALTRWPTRTGCGSRNPRKTAKSNTAFN
jgi:hypothetical protein